MVGRLVLQGEVEAELSDEQVAELKQHARDVVESIDQVSDWRVLYQERQDVSQIGLVLRTELDRLASRPGKGRYLGILIVDDAGGMISEKFITNPAIKQDKGRDPLALNVLRNNGVQRVLLAEDPDEVLKMTLDELELDYAVPESDQLSYIKENLESLA